MTTYDERLRTRAAALGALCVGIDPHGRLLDDWGLPATAAGVERFARGAVESLGDIVTVFKPQSAFFEAYGSAGVAALEATIADARAAGALVIVDAKRGDIGSTMAAYADAYLVDGPLAGDAVTLSPYLGVGALEPAFATAAQHDRAVYVLARTSNSEGDRIQLATAAGQEEAHATTVVQTVVDDVAALNARYGAPIGGLVIGATHGRIDCDISHMTGSILVPGIGVQGGRMSDLTRLFGNTSCLILPSVSRAVLQAGPSREMLRDKVKSLIVS